MSECNRSHWPLLTCLRRLHQNCAHVEGGTKLTCVNHQQDDLFDLAVIKMFTARAKVSWLVSDRVNYNCSIPTQVSVPVSRNILKPF